MHCERKAGVQLVQQLIKAYNSVLYPVGTAYHHMLHARRQKWPSCDGQQRVNYCFHFGCGLNYAPAYSLHHHLEVAAFYQRSSKLHRALSWTWKGRPSASPQTTACILYTVILQHDGYSAETRSFPSVLQNLRRWEKRSETIQGSTTGERFHGFPQGLEPPFIQVI